MTAAVTMSVPPSFATLSEAGPTSAADVAAASRAILTIWPDAPTANEVGGAAAAGDRHGRHARWAWWPSADARRLWHGTDADRVLAGGLVLDLFSIRLDLHHPARLQHVAHAVLAVVRAGRAAHATQKPTKP